MFKSKDELREYLHPFKLFKYNTYKLLGELKSLHEQYEGSKFELQIDLSSGFYRLSFCSFFVSALNNIRTMFCEENKLSFYCLLKNVENGKEFLASDDDVYDLNYINNILIKTNQELDYWTKKVNEIDTSKNEYELQSYMFNYMDFDSSFSSMNLFLKYMPIVDELIETINFVDFTCDKLFINIYEGIKDKDYNKIYVSDISKTLNVVKEFYLEWNEVNLYLKRYRGDCDEFDLDIIDDKVDGLSENSKEKLRKLIDEISTFPDSEPTVSGSAALLRQYLRDKYKSLSDEGIEMLIDIYCTWNRF